MRLHEIVSDGDWKFVLELHPRITVVTGLGEDRTAEMAELLVDVIRGHPCDVDAVLEVEGQRLVLEEWWQIASGEVGPVELALRAGDLSGVSGDAVGAARSEVKTAERALAQARRAVADAERSLQAEGSASMRHALDQASEAVAQAEAERARVHNQIVDAKAASASAAQDAVEAERVAEVSAVDAEAAAKRQPLVTRLAESPQFDPQGVEAVSRALEAMPSPADTERESAARELLGELDELTPDAGNPADFSADFSAAPEWLVSSARQTLEEARAASIKAELAAKPFSVSAADAADLERAHRDVVEAEDRASRTLRGPLARSRLEAANAALQIVLDRIGVRSYSAYLLRDLDVDERTECIEEFDRARRALADAEAVWEELRAGNAETPSRRSEQELRWRADAAALLGVADEAGEELEAVAERLRRLADQRGGARAALAEALGRYGIALGPDNDPELAATRWLTAAHTAPGEAGRFAADLAERVAIAAARVDALGPLAVQADRRFEDALMAQEIAKSGLAAVDGVPVAGRPSEELLRLRAEVRIRQQKADSARAALDRAVDGQDDATPAASAADLEIYILARLAAVRSVGSVGALPLVMIDPFARLDREQTSKLHSTFARMSEVVQLIYLTDSPDALTWADQLGQDRAAVRGVGSLVRPDPPAEPEGAGGRTVEGANLRRRPYGFGHRRRRS